MLENQCRLIIRAIPTEHGWYFTYQVLQGKRPVIPEKFFGTGTRENVRRDFFSVKKPPNADYFVLYQERQPHVVFLILDCAALRFLTVAHELRNTPSLLDELQAATKTEAYTLETFQRRDS